VLDDRRKIREASHLSGEVDVAVAGTVGAKLLRVAARTVGTTVELDCAELTFIDASGIAMLLDVADSSGKQVRLVNLGASCCRVFEVLDLCERFGIEGPAPREELTRLPLPA
jgi:anti-anti-sigma factor